MKKILILIALALLVPSFVFADPASYARVNGLIDSGMMKNRDQISYLSSGLSSSEAMMLYNSNKMNSGVPFALNFLLGYGIGSFVQGDTAGGVTALVGELIGGAALLGGYACYGVALVNHDYSDNQADIDAATSQLALGAGLIIGGGVVLIGMRIYEMIRPFSYAKKYNETLFEALNSSYGTTLAILPSSLDDSLGVTALASIRF